MSQRHSQVDRRSQRSRHFDTVYVVRTFLLVYVRYVSLTPTWIVDLPSVV